MLHRNDQCCIAAMFSGMAKTHGFHCFFTLPCWRMADRVAG
jgi:hypothetical protein